jgi:hypothetical protein
MKSVGIGSAQQHRRKLIAVGDEPNNDQHDSFHSP